MEIADRAYVLDDGHVVFSGEAKEFAKDEQHVCALAGASAEEWTIVSVFVPPEYGPYRPRLRRTPSRAR